MMTEHKLKRVKTNLYDTAWRGVLSSNEFGVTVVNATTGNGCYYRTEDGNKCAVGHNIPDSVYFPDMEFLDISDLLSRHGADMIENYNLCDNAQQHEIDVFLRELQGAHDKPAQEYATGKITKKEAMNAFKAQMRILFEAANLI